jgi:predicted permease
VATGGVNGLPMSGEGNNGQFLIDDNPLLKGYGEYRVASSGYFRTIGIRLLRGRLLDQTDGPNAPHAAVISETLARQYFSNQDPIGRTIQYGNMDGDKRLLHIVGIVNDVREFGLETKPQPTVYVHYMQRPLQARTFFIVARTQSDATALIPAMRRTLRSLDSDVPANFSTLDRIFSDSLSTRRFSLIIFGVFATVALVLAAIGIYGITSYAVTQRTSEIGIRIALGAQVRDVLRLTIGYGIKSVVVGAAIGLAGALALTRFMSNLLFDVTSTDPVTFLSVTALLLLVAMLACFLPARRATKVDPIEALRYQ